MIKPGDRVLYVPNHANGDRSHPDCEAGRVTSIGEQDTVFVLFDDPGSMGRSKACYAADLVRSE